LTQTALYWKIGKFTPNVATFATYKMA